MLAKLLSLLIITLLLISNSIYAESFSIIQKNKAFSQKNLTISKGDEIVFINHDPLFHNIYSLDVEPFDLGAVPYKGIQKHTFNKTGKYAIECAIHPFMTLKVNVK